MRDYLKLLLIFIAISFFSVACIQADESAIQETGASLAPDFKLQDMNQDTVTLSSYRDKQPVFLFFWTTWCPFCREQIRIINTMYPVLAKEGLEVLLINIGESESRVDKFIKNYNVVYKILLDKDTKVATAYGILGVPTYILVDKKGYIRLERNYFPKEEYKALILR